MKPQSIFLAFIICFTSCQQDNLKEVLVTSQTPNLDMIYHAVVKANMEELGSSISIVDRTMDTTSFEFDGLKPEFGASGEMIYWNKAIFPDATYLSGDSLHLYMNGQTEKYWELREKEKSGWIEISVPYLTKDSKHALIEVSYFFGSTFGSTTGFQLDLIDNEYQIVGQQLLSIS
jgi:hypothetical protein